MTISKGNWEGKLKVSPKGEISWGTDETRVTVAGTEMLWQGIPKSTERLRFRRKIP